MVLGGTGVILAWRLVDPQILIENFYREFQGKTSASQESIVASHLTPTDTPVTRPSKPPTPKAPELIYNPKVAPNLQFSAELQGIVDTGVKLAAAQELPLENLSIYLIDVQHQTFAEYRSQTPRFPASVAKLFWMVALYGQVNARQLPPDAVAYTPECQTDVCKLIQYSDNESASNIIDQLTQTTSDLTKPPKEYKDWLNQRHSINQFFQKAGYQQIDVSQKNYPIPSLGMDQPEDWELKMRGSWEQPIRNQITASQVGRIMYEIVRNKAISPAASQAMLNLLTRNLNPDTWQAEEYTALYEFLGEPFIGTEVQFASKVGWTSDSRTEVAFIRDPSGQVAYVLAVLGDGEPYSANVSFFPALSQSIYNQMMALPKPKTQNLQSND
ncbi:MAG: serine hydrolase [Oscillatoriales cyanobacterium RM2_1_1]|nr:serine hydrolase [Oscillatoriales cyanobacterium SM2_3_0]NJO44442.1 serine hydrolase [Oscillatoriales cyanobacterium RM2_1_1]